MMSDNRKIGTGLLALGGIFLFLGVILFFDAGLLAMGECAASTLKRSVQQYLLPRFVAPLRGVETSAKRWATKRVFACSNLRILKCGTPRYTEKANLQFALFWSERRNATPLVCVPLESGFLTYALSAEGVQKWQ